MILRRVAVSMLGLGCATVLTFGQCAGAQSPGGVRGLGDEQQFPASVFGTGTVSGHVLCGDTQRLARFATVSLVPKPMPAKSGAPASTATNAQSGRQSRQPETEQISLQMVQGKTGLDGSFAIQNLPAGDYFAVATMPGYVLPISDSGEPMGSEHVDINKVLANFPLVHVEPNRSSSVELTMQRGAVIAGRVEFEDGSPAANVYVSVRSSDGKDPMQQLVGAGLRQLTGVFAARPPQTDDDGRYRIAGLQPGKYIVSANLQMQGTMRMAGSSHGSNGRPDHNEDSSPIVVYAPGVFIKSQAKPVEVHAGEVNSVADVQVNLSGMHRVQGRVLAQSDRHPLSNVGLSLSLGKDFDAWTTADDDGSFHFDYVPEGSYTLNAQAFDMKPDSKPEQPEIARVYVSPKMPVVVAAQDVVLGDILLTVGKMTDMEVIDDSGGPQ
jgi:hypothetical protein